ncbi:TonB-dependent receptor domain-containing protein [Pseudomonas sp. NCCP-436]|uniref:TonB-dependent receptor domain-containing protein n=1 Tax=Pseudomonas sp. NCCP-436 TaxID=2842481 RepID=UPI001C80150E|nr:TonB-dependent receptor [Pseudomonas sp. NCCP-436]GIZ11537.1 ligand-gated channel [Pseudomonas sp. NCCP-436]
MYTFTPRTALASAIALVTSLGAQANEPIALGDVVVSASGFEQKITEAPASISVISREELQQKSYANLAEALEEVEGIDVRQGTGKTGGLNISIRGMPSKFTLVLIDGRRQNAPGAVAPNGFGETSNNFIPPLSSIERIEVIRGPMSTLYGSDAMGGVINIITRKVGKEWTGSVGVEHTFQENRDYGESSKTNFYTSGPLVENLLGLQMRGSFYDRKASDLTFDNDSTVSRRGAAPVEGDNYSLGGRLTLTPNEAHELALDVERGVQRYNNDDCQLGNLDGWNGGSDTVGCSTLNPSKINGYTDEQRFIREQVALSHTGHFELGTWDSSLMRNKTETLGRTVPGTLGVPYDAPYEALIGGQDRKLESVSTVFDTKFTAPIGDSNILTVGGQWWKQELKDTVALTTFEQTIKAVFLENEWRINDALALTVGARYDDHETFGGHVSPRAYLVWNANDNWTLKGGISKGFKAPDPDELHNGINGITSQGQSKTIGNPDLKPEESTNTEIGAYFDNLGGFTANVTLFHTKYKNKLGDGDPVQDPLCVGNPATSSVPQDHCAWTVNLGEAISQGVEVGSRWQFAPGWSLSGNYTYTDTYQKTNEANNKGAPISNTPLHMAHASLNWQATDRLSLYFKGEYRGERARYNKRGVNYTADERQIMDQLGDLKAYDVWHLGGSFKASKELTLHAAINNLFDRDFLSGSTYINAAGNPVWASDYVRFERATATGTLEEGRRLWLSAVYEF